MPTDEQLDAMSMKLAGVPWAAIQNPLNRIPVMQLAIAAMQAEAVWNIEESVTTFVKDHAVLSKAAIDGWNNLDVELTKISDWFKNSKLFDGIDRR